uniref:Uncharacterized protein n=1 Tax=Myotis myotis TaxID=51298 RepID=A0A7J7WHP5_MYOMY|nr:hypothetical protein mMyoMyo1_012106 [Myotis myotis]
MPPLRQPTLVLVTGCFGDPRRVPASPAVRETRFTLGPRPSKVAFAARRTVDSAHRERLIAPLFHAICLTWTHSKRSGFAGRMIFLLQKFCNLLIDRYETDGKEGVCFIEQDAVSGMADLPEWLIPSVIILSTGVLRPQHLLGGLVA